MVILESAFLSKYTNQLHADVKYWYTGEHHSDTWGCTRPPLTVVIGDGIDGFAYNRKVGFFDTYIDDFIGACMIFRLNANNITCGRIDENGKHEIFSVNLRMVDSPIFV